LGPFEKARRDLLLLERERRRRLRDEGKLSYRARDHLHAAQLRAHELTEVLEDGTVALARFRAFFAGRRGGKTTLVQHEMIEAAVANPGCAVVYIGPTINLAVKTVWQELKEWSEPLGAVANEANHWITYPNGAVIYILGAETKTTIDRVRGIKRIVYLAWDEQQNYKSEFAIYGVGSVITPALADKQGRLVLLGTGGPPSGYWHDVVTNPDLGYVVGRWTIWDNPTIKNPDAEVERACKQRGVTRADPYIRREWGSSETGIEFTTDSERSVFPRIVTREVSLLPGGRYVIGGDVGSVDCSGVAVYWLHRNHPGIVLVASEKRKTKGSSDQVALFKEYAERYQALSSERVLLAIDPGGGGKGAIEDLARLGGYYDPMPAEKLHKGFNCRLMADDVRTGFLSIAPGNKAVIDGLEALEWEPGKEGEKLRGHSDDAADGALYGWRLAKKLYAYDEPKAPEPHADDELDAAYERQERIAEEMRLYGLA
jgi:hypothetical protein